MVRAHDEEFLQFGPHDRPDGPIKELSLAGFNSTMNTMVILVSRVCTDRCPVRESQD